MKAKGIKVVDNQQIHCSADEATHLIIRMPSDEGLLCLPVTTKGSRKDAPCWTWNGNEDKPSLKPSVLINREHKKFICHSFITDGQAIFLSDCTHDMANETVDLLEIKEDE